MKKIASLILQVIGTVVFFSGIANLYIEFSDKWLVCVGLLVFVVGTIVGTKAEIIESKPKESAFKRRLNEAMKQREESSSNLSQKPTPRTTIDATINKLN